jgi:aldehyde:ferredoxin oxidoreductase
VQEHGGVLNRAMRLEEHLIDGPVHIHNLDLLWGKMMYPTDERVRHSLQVVVMCLGQAIENNDPRQNASRFDAICEGGVVANLLIFRVDS